MGRKETGRMGEGLAASALEKNGYHVVARNVHSLHGEVDLIAEGEGCIAFIEVRTRQKDSMVCPLESVTPAKKRRIILTALLYLRNHPSDLQPRFDLFSILTTGNKVDSYEHIKGAFEADGY